MKCLAAEGNPSVEDALQLGKSLPTRVIYLGSIPASPTFAPGRLGGRARVETP